MLVQLYLSCIERKEGCRKRFRFRGVRCDLNLNGLRPAQSERKDPRLILSSASERFDLRIAGGARHASHSFFSGEIRTGRGRRWKETAALSNWRRWRRRMDIIVRN